MILYQLIQRESAGNRLRFVAAAVLSAVANTSVLAIVDAGFHARGEWNIALWILLALSCAAFAVSYSYCVTVVTRRIEAALYKIRIRLGEKIRRAELITLEQIGTAKIYEQIVQQTTVISNSSWLIALGLQALMLLIVVLVYIFYLSRVLFFLVAFWLLVAGPLYYARSREVEAHIDQVSAERLSLYNLLGDFLFGFQEHRLRARRSDDLYAHYEQAATALQERTVRVHILDQENVNFMSFNLYALLATTVFVLPQFIQSNTQLLSELSAAALFLIAPLAILAFTMPEYERAESAARGIQKLEQRLERAELVPPVVVDPFGGAFGVIEADALCFSYPESGGDGFALGPVSLSLRAGEIVFFVGGNGSGKTTLLKVLTGLYTPSAGALRVDGRRIEPANRQAYRELIAAIFTDFHLFPKLYGISDATAEQIAGLLRQLDLDEKTGYGPAGFTNLALSTGQRKRLAMLVALLEDRPIYVFDEWAADQDPEFRRYYYEELLPDLQRRGKTVLAISHDDRYFHCADRVVFMEDGAIRATREQRA